MSSKELDTIYPLPNSLSSSFCSCPIPHPPSLSSPSLRFLSHLPTCPPLSQVLLPPTLHLLSASSLIPLLLIPASPPSPFPPLSLAPVLFCHCCPAPSCRPRGTSQAPSTSSETALASERRRWSGSLARLCARAGNLRAQWGWGE